jgi:Rrf2 family nitric oxide-sensitive transcriptional repressor
MRLVHRLERKGYLETIRGKKGGMRLACRPGEIAVGAVVRDMEEELHVVGCLDGEEYCRIRQCCVLRGALPEATSAFLASLDRYTLADLIRPRHALARLLGIEARPPTP